MFRSAADVYCALQHASYSWTLALSLTCASGAAMRAYKQLWVAAEAQARKCSAGMWGGDA